MKKTGRKSLTGRMFAVLIAAVMVFCLCACGKSDTEAGKNNSNANGNGNTGKETTQSGNGGTQGNNGGQDNNGGNGDATQGNNGNNGGNESSGNNGGGQGNGNSDVMQGGNGNIGPDGNDSNSGTTDTSGQQAGGLQVVIHGKGQADFIIPDVDMTQGNEYEYMVYFDTKDKGYMASLLEIPDSGWDLFVGEADNVEHRSFSYMSADKEYAVTGNCLTISLQISKEYFSFYDITQYTLCRVENHERNEETYAAADVVKDWDILIAGVEQNAEAEFPCKPEILYGIRDARFMMDVSGQTEADGWQEYQIFFEMNGETCCVKMVRDNRVAGYSSYVGGGNLRAVNTEKTELEIYEYAEYAADTRYDEETGKMYVDISGLIGGRFLDIEQYTVRHSYYDESHHEIVEEKTFAASEVARLNYNPASDFKYEDDGNGGIVLTGFTGSGGSELIIPREIDGKPVTAIGYTGVGYWLSGFQVSKGIMVPDSVKTLGDYCFHGTGGADLILPEGLTVIGKGAFGNCNGITEITLPSTVTYIGPEAFLSCDNLRRVVLPDGLETISDSMFSDTPLREVILPKNLKTIERYAFSQEYRWGCPLESITFPEGLESIGYRAFFHCEELKSVILPDSLTDLGEDAFAECSSLTSVTISKGLKEISSGAFFQCGLTSVIIPGNVTTIGGGCIP